MTISDFRKKPHYVKKHVYGILKPGGSSVCSMFHSEHQARVDVMCTLICGTIVRTDFKGNTPVCVARKHFQYSVGTFKDRHCYNIEVIFVDKSDLGEQDIITAYPM